jgi:hypothetical protein
MCFIARILVATWDLKLAAYRRGSHRTTARRAPLSVMAERSVILPRMPTPASNDSSPKLVNNLTIADARHLLNNEGGELTFTDVVLKLGAAAIVAAAIAWALWRGNATVWHLALPPVAQYLTLLVAIPLVYVVLRHPALKKESFGAIRFMAAVAIILTIAVAVRAYRDGVPWRAQFAADSALTWRWIVDAHMHWPILAAVAAMLIELPGRVRNLYQHGPPFVGVSLGCAMQFVILLLGFMAIPWALEDARRMAWTLWAVMILADLLALGMHLDIQRRLRKVESRSNASSALP